VIWSCGVTSISLTTLGGGGEIGANCFEVSTNGHRILLDCGMHPKKDGADCLPELALMKGAPEAVILSHAHIDHCGAIPYLIRQHPSVSCYATRPTVPIMDRMLHNSVAVMGMLALEQGIEEYPLYSHADVDYALSQCYAMEYDSEFAVSWHSPWRVTLRHAGHVLGSASIILRLEEHTLFYTGDVCATRQELMNGMPALDTELAVDTLIIEATRGAQEDVDGVTYSSEETRFAEEARCVLEGDGCVLVPCFALGRTQELLNMINRLQRDGALPDVPVYASGLGRAIYEIYDRFTDYLAPDAELCPLNRFKRIGDVWERDVRRQLTRFPCIIVATSGMMIENTPSAMIAMEMVREKRHGIFFVGYVDPDTPGGQLLAGGAGRAYCFERGAKSVKVRLSNIQNFSFSAHAPRSDLLAVIERLRPKNVVFVHGDSDAIEWMHDNSGNDFQKFAPTMGETIELSS
jgi:Cft2 family RNA processing exonuclease